MVNKIATCPTCKKEFEKKKKSSTYCSRKCSAIANSDKIHANIEKKGKYIKCLHCGKSFYIPKNRFKTAQFCSLKCKGLHEREINTSICAICGNKFIHISSRVNKAKYCSRQCYYKSMRTKGTIEKTCPICNKKFLTSPSHNQLYCSTDCRGKASRKKFEDLKVQTSIRTYLKRKNLIKKCADCGYNKYSEILGIHHADGNHQNNNIENLVILCPTCHSIRHLKHIPHYTGGLLV